MISYLTTARVGVAHITRIRHDEKKFGIEEESKRNVKSLFTMKKGGEERLEERGEEGKEKGEKRDKRLFCCDVKCMCGRQDRGRVAPAL